MLRLLPVFPPYTSLAERVWSQAAQCRLGDFMRRLNTHAQRLDALEVNYRKWKA